VTALDTPPVVDEPIVAEPDGGPPPLDVGPPAPPVRARWPFVAVAIVLTVLVVVIASFEVGVTSIWYHARQRQLATDFKLGRSHLAPGDAAAVIQIPRLDVNLYVVEGDTVAQLRSGPGHRPGTPLPGKRGNSVIVGHRKAWGHPFRDLGKLRPRRDVVFAAIRGAEPALFVVRTVRHVPAGDSRLLRPSTDHRLTLVAGDGGLLSDDRLVVTAVSGPVGSFRAGRSAPGDPDEPSVILNGDVALAVVAFGLAWLALGYLRVRYGVLATVAVVGPLLVAGLVCVLLWVDLVLAPLR
jgi:sortase A